MAGKGKSKVAGQGALVSFRCHLDWLDIVRKLLGDENMLRLRKSCFGHFFELADLQFQGQLYHILVRNHLLPEIENRLSFDINGRLHEFGPVEFGLMTGLKFRGWYEPPTSSNIHSLFFTNKRSLKFADISLAFRRECEKTEGRSLYSLKLALLFVLYAVVLPRDRKEKNIEMQYVHLADDVKTFENYAWGRVSYDYLLRATHSRRRLVDNILKQEKRMAYDVFGFVLAMQTWVYEFMPYLARDCAHAVKGYQNRFPRMLRWRVDEFFQYDELSGYFIPENAERVGIVTPSKHEWQSLQELGLAERHMSPPKLILNPPVSKRKGGDRGVAPVAAKKLRVEAESAVKSMLRSGRLKAKNANVDSTAESKRIQEMHEGAESGGEETVSNVTLLEIDVQMKAFFRKMEEVENLIRRCKCCWKTVGEAVVGDLNDEGEVCADFDESTPLEAPLDVEIERHVGDKAQDGIFEGDGTVIGINELLDECLTPLNAADVSRKRGKGSCLGVASDEKKLGTRSSKRLSKAPADVTPEKRLVDEESSGEFIGDSHQQARITAGPSCTKSVARELFGSKGDRMHDPLEATFHPNNVKAFEDWHDAAKKLNPEPETPLPLISKPFVSVSWFDDLLGRKEWLWDEHIDALTNLLLWKYSRAKERFESGWAVVDVLGTGFLMNGDFERSWSTVKNYVNGVWPREGPLRWVDAKQVLGVANVSGNHWVCYAIRFESQSVTIYDSLRGDLSWPIIASHFDHMARYIPWLCANAGIWKEKKMAEDLRWVWDVVSAVDAPQQIGNHDCGIMAVKFMECLACNHDMSTLSPARCGIFRRVYCAQLWELGLQFPAEEGRGAADKVKPAEK